MGIQDQARQDADGQRPIDAARFEEILTRLGSVVDKLEAGELPLEDSLLLFEEGVRLSRLGAARLDEVDAVALADAERTPVDDAAIGALVDGELAGAGLGDRRTAADHHTARRQLCALSMDAIVETEQAAGDHCREGGARKQRGASAVMDRGCVGRPGNHRGDGAHALPP